MKWFGRTKKKQKGDALVPRGISTTIIPNEFIDGNKTPIWDNMNILLKNSKKELIYVNNQR